ncbi:hypothetical protein [Nocardia harenae]|uniref:hypothetical protein n=1 Tax=Nocardia harenae TaxID=358707 RepID=UPI000836E6E7|nr:hypothetical protein [Nocardia harenae]
MAVEVGGVKAAPVLIFAPGLGAGSANTAEALAAVLAEEMTQADACRVFTAVSAAEVPAPPALTVAPTVVDGENRPILQVFEYDYRNALDPSTAPATPSVVGGMVKSVVLAVRGLVHLARAWRRPAKGLRTKVQLAAGMAAVGSLGFGVLIAGYALLATLGLDLPLWMWLGTEEQNATATFGVATTASALTWAGVRRRILALAAVADRFIRYAHNDDSVASTITQRLDSAVVQLRRNGWTGPVHLLGYCFGSLVVLDAVLPRATDLHGHAAMDSVQQIWTVGSPLDIVRLYAPSFLAGRTARKPDVSWCNIFNEADILASNLRDADDAGAGAGSFELNGVRAESIRYTGEAVGPARLLVTARAHSAYWSTPDRANCLHPVARAFLAAAARPAS